MAPVFHLDRALLRISGPDCVGFLNNLLTQNVDDEAPRYAALLSPQGKVVADMLLWPNSGADELAVMLELDPACAGEVEKRLTLFKLRAKVAIADVSGQFRVLHSTAPFASAAVDPRFPDGALGWRQVSPQAAAHMHFEDGAAPYDALRLRLGVPELARDAAVEEVFAGEALLEELHGVDFQKGCFVGQENVSRMKRRATTRKKFCPIVFEGDAPRFGAAVNAGEVQIGAVRTGATGRAMALVRLDRATQAFENGVPLSAEGRQIRLEPPPWLVLPSREEA